MDAEEKTIAGFYDDLAPEYDEMTGLEKRFVQERPFFRLLVERFHIATALDAGCGSGFHALLLSELGVEVTAIDASKEMIRLLEKHAGERNMRIDRIVGTFESLNTLVSKKFDAVFSMGNSLAHVLTNQALSRSLRNFHSVLKPGGILFVQLLNYDRILERRERILGEKTTGTKTFVRFYEYEKDAIVFNILTKSSDATSSAEHIQSVRLHPLVRDELIPQLESVGFKELSVFGSISLDAFRKKDSKDLVVLAHKVPTKD